MTRDELIAELQKHPNCEVLVNSADLLPEDIVKDTSDVGNQVINIVPDERI